MKTLCETSGNFQLVDVYNGGQIVRGTRPSVVQQTDFVNNRALVGQIKFLGELTDEATDAEFAKYWRETMGDSARAVDSFLAAFGVQRQTEKKVPKTQKKNVAEVEAVDPQE